jgi:hypothetical protein
MWLVLGLIGGYMLWLLHEATGVNVHLEAATSQWALYLQFLCPVAVGVLLADRYVRDRRTRVVELLEATPSSDVTMLAGKYIGATSATVLPILLVYTIGIVWLAGQQDAATVFSRAVPAFLLINLPGLLFVSAFSICAPIVMKVPLYQFLFVGYWFWGNLMPPSVIPTLTFTWLTPIGTVAAEAFFHSFVDVGSYPAWAPLDAVTSISLLLALAVAALVVGLMVSRWQRSRA